MCTQTPKISVKFLLGQELAQVWGKKHKLVLQGLRFLRLCPPPFPHEQVSLAEKERGQILSVTCWLNPLLN